MAKRVFTSELKLEAAKLVRERQVSAAQAARDLDIHPNVLRKWVKQYDAEGTEAYSASSPSKLDPQEIARLRRGLIKVKAERDILKKAAAYFAKESK